MQTVLRKDIYEHQALVFSGTAGRETSDEFVVPDTLPDIGTIVESEGILTLRAKDTETGYVQLSAAVSVSVMYMPENGTEMKSLELSLPADIRMDAPGADGECRTVARMRVRSIEARAVNSRKVAVRAELEAEARCYRREGLEIASGVEEDGNAAHLLTKTAEMMTVSDVREKTFVVTDDYQLPAGCGEAGSVLSRRVEAVVEDIQYAGGKVVFRGRVRTELIFSEAESERAVAGRYETEFSQIMEAGGTESDVMPEVTLLLTGAYFDLPEYGSEQGRVQAELHFAAQCVCRAKKQMRYIADIYSNRMPLTPEFDDVPVTTDIRPVTLRQTVAGRAEPFSGETEALSVSAAVGGVAVEEGTVKTSVTIRVISRRREGGYAASRCRLTAEFTSQELVAFTDLGGVSVTVTDVYCAGPDVRATLQMQAMGTVSGTVSCVAAVSGEDDAAQGGERAPSATLIRVAPGADMWPLAKRYRSTVEAIAAANEGRTDGLLLVPKDR